MDGTAPGTDGSISSLYLDLNFFNSTATDIHFGIKPQGYFLQTEVLPAIRFDRDSTQPLQSVNALSSSPLDCPPTAFAPFEYGNIHMPPNMANINHQQYHYPQRLSLPFHDGQTPNGPPTTVTGGEKADRCKKYDRRKPDRRQADACVRCRAKKLKCDTSRGPTAPCSPCTRSNARCEDLHPNSGRLLLRGHLERTEADLLRMKGLLARANEHNALLEAKLQVEANNQKMPETSRHPQLPSIHELELLKLGDQPKFMHMQSRKTQPLHGVSCQSFPSQDMEA